MAKQRTAKRLRNAITKANFPYVYISGLYREDSREESDYSVIVVLKDVTADTTELDQLAAELKVPVVYRPEKSTS